MTSNSSYPDKQSHILHPRYRPDINGLRAIAVLSVLVFHAFPTLLPGGFVGVDIFCYFRLPDIHHHFQNLRNGSFSFTDFYARRIRRIFPALLLVLFACLVAGWFSLVAEEYAQLGKHIAAGAGFVSNLALWSESGYFDTASSAKPLLHLWSLGIEEQFYLIWPLLPWLAWKKKLSIPATTLTLMLMSFGVNLSTVGSNAVAAYYSPIGRSWELLVGAFLAFRLASSTIEKNHSHSNLRATSGLLLIAASIALIDKNALFPGWWALLPVAGTVLLLEAHDAWFNRHVLSNRFIVWIGLISYPLYLWHWPLLSFAEILVGKVPAPEYRLLCLLAAIFLAWLTFLIIERPYRAKLYRLRQVFYLSALMALIGFLGFNIMNRDGLPFRHEQLSPRKPANSKAAGFTSLGVSIQQDHVNYSCEGLVLRTTKKVDTFCHLVGSEPYLAVIGDSHSNHLFFGLKNTPNAKANQVLVVGAGSCHPAMQGGQSENCDDQIKANLELIKKFGTNKYVVLSADSSLIQTRTKPQYDVLLRGYLNTVAQLQSLGKTVIFNIDTPGFMESPASCALNPLPLRNMYKSTGELCEKIPIGKTLPRNVYDRFVHDLMRQNKFIIFLTPILCSVVTITARFLTMPPCCSRIPTISLTTAVSWWRISCRHW